MAETARCKAVETERASTMPSSRPDYELGLDLKSGREAREELQTEEG